MPSQYGTQADLQLALPARAISDPAITPDLITKHLQAASAYADSFMRARYTLPIAGQLEPVNTFPAELVRNVVAIAAKSLLDFRGWDPQGSDGTFLENWKAAEAWLRMLAKGVVHLDSALDATPATHEGAGDAAHAGVVGYTSARGWDDFDDSLGEPSGAFWSPWGKE